MFNFIQKYENYHIQDDFDTYDLSVVSLRVELINIYSEYLSKFEPKEPLDTINDIREWKDVNYINDNTTVGEMYDLANEFIKCLWTKAIKHIINKYQNV